ncbi:MAG TPA: chemotaxis protein [Selenomonadales bacterium]|nr:chemotaxis protein [Selenomonadales bacterium]
MQDKTGILLETGTNEFEIVEFAVGSLIGGINVAKVREVINPVEVTKLPNSHPYTDGIFTLRGKVMPLINLARCLGTEDSEKFNIIVGELNQVYVGFKVSSVSRIHRISWEAMEPPPEVANANLVNGIIKMQDKLILLLDFERIVADINPTISAKLSKIPASAQNIVDARQGKTILVAEDSHLLRDLILATLHTAGYTQVVTKENGKEAWDELEKNLANKGAKRFDLVITDIEMPKMDGHHLTKKIKEHNDLKEVPVVIFSSLINEEMRRKGEAIGADAQVTKPEIEQLIQLIDSLVTQR